MKTIKHLSWNLDWAILPGEVEKDMWNGKEQNGLWEGRCFNNVSSSGSFGYLNLNLLIYLKEVYRREIRFFHCKKKKKKGRESGRLQMDRVFPYTKVKTQGTYSLNLIKMIGSGLSGLWCWTIKPQYLATEGIGIVAGHQMQQRQSVKLQ